LNWLGDLVQKEVRSWDSVISLGCGIMQGLGDWAYKSYPKTILDCGELYGVDAYLPYLSYLKTLRMGIYTVHADLERDLPLDFPDKKFDVVLLLDIIEHLTGMDKVVCLINEAVRLAKRRVIINTPKFLEDNASGRSVWGLGVNEKQRHHLVVSEDLLRGYGFKVKTLFKDKYVFYGVKKL